MPRRSASTTPVWPCPWSSDCRPVSTRSNFSSAIAAASASAVTNASAAAKRVVFDVNRAVGAARQRLANHLLHPRRPCRADDHLAAVLLAQAQRLLERIGVRLVHLVADVLFADPGLVVAQARLPLAGGDLLDADGDLHAVSTTTDTTIAKVTNRQRVLVSSSPRVFVVCVSHPSYFLNSSAALVPPKPNEFESAYGSHLHGAALVRHVVEIALGVGVVEVDRRRHDLVVAPRAPRCRLRGRRRRRAGGRSSTWWTKSRACARARRSSA